MIIYKLEMKILIIIENESNQFDNMVKNQPNARCWYMMVTCTNIANQMLPMIIIDVVNQYRKLWQNVQLRLIFQKIKLK